MWNRTEDQIELYLIRHGMTAGNAMHRYIGGRTDEPLSEEGRWQLENRKNWLLGIGSFPQKIQTQTESGYEKSGITSESIYDSDSFSGIFVSPMLRCRQTAEILFPGQPQIEIDAWREMDFGAFEGKNYQELNGDPRYQEWIDSGGTLAFPGGESREDFIARCVEGMELVMEYLRSQFVGQSCIECGRETDYPKEMKYSSEPIAADGVQQSTLKFAAVVHGGIIMALLSHYCGGDYFSYQVKNGEGYHLRLHLQENKMELKEKL